MQTDGSISVTILPVKGLLHMRMIGSIKANGISSNGMTGEMGDMFKTSIRFFNGREGRAVWDDATNGWFFSVLDVVGVLNGQDDYAKNRNYWKWLKAKLKREGNQLVSATTQLRLTAADGKKCRTTMMKTTKDFGGCHATK